MNNDLISRSALLEILRHCNDEPGDVESDEYFEWDNMCAPELLEKILDVVETFSPVDAEPVRHGEWKRDGEVYNDATWTCSVCGEPWTLLYGTPEENGMHYCPNCGAKMDLEDE